MVESFPIKSLTIKIFPWMGMLLLITGGGFFGCTGTPKISEAPSTGIEPPFATSSPGPTVEQRGKGEPSEEITAEGVESLPIVASAAVTEQKEKDTSIEGKKIEGMDMGKPENETTTSPTLRTIGLFDGFMFSVPNPMVRWKADPVGTPVRVELYKEIVLAPENLIWAETSPKDHVRLPDLSEGKEYYLRIGVFQKDTFLKETVLTFTVSYRSFSVPMLPVLKPGNTASFIMGFNRGLEREKPEHPVTLTRPYALSTYEVTNQEFAHVMNRLLKGGILRWEGRNLISSEGIVIAGREGLTFGTQFGFTEKDGLLAPHPGREKHPVVGVSWYGAFAFCYYLSLMEGLEPGITFDPSDPKNTITFQLDAEGYRLPTEAEWEYAARGERNLLYPGGVLSTSGVNFYRSEDPFEGYRTISEAGGPTTPVGYFDGSIRGRFRTTSGVGPFGHFDLLGNVWEWCNDWFDPLYYRDSPKEDPLGPATGFQRVVRGGAWNTQRQDLRLTLRGFFPPEGTSHSIGFRLARTLK